MVIFNHLKKSEPFITKFITNNKTFLDPINAEDIVSPFFSTFFQKSGVKMNVLTESVSKLRSSG